MQDQVKLFEFPVRVYIEDTDIGGIVYYVNYLKFMERARTEFLRQHQISQQQLKQQGFLFVVKSVSCDYKAAAKLDDLLTITVDIEHSSAARVIFKQRVMSDKVLCEAQVQVVCVNAQTMKPCRIPTHIKQIFKQVNE